MNVWFPSELSQRQNQEQDSQVNYRDREPDRRMLIKGVKYYVEITFNSGYWRAIELNAWGGFRRRLYEERYDAERDTNS